MRTDVEREIKTCHRCQRYRSSPIPKNTSTMLTPVEKPFVRAGLSIVGPFPVTKNGNKLQ
ncbi:hypothetical protein PIROE2DRAFT_11336 [Piromyces sp. E2]|nr:hypothetical protein PIROE2DRAFT_11336 [Piromyces sp. E2]|eukprot:OUM62381.1 hypothetical protein PIROE2DRAFT_11336 [Piromyces sp. E2]